MKTVYSVEAAVRQIIQTEIKELVEYNGAPYIKFLLLSVAIEFLGACMDSHAFEDDRQSKDRFNKALKKLFPKKYHKYSKKGAKINLFRDFRCGMIHKLRPSNGVRFSERKYHNPGVNEHLLEKDGRLLLVLEDFYDDLDIACENLKKLARENKLPTKKLEEEYIRVTETISEENSDGLTKFIKS